MTDDAELLDSWRHGDPRSGQALFERYFDQVSRFFINKVPHDHEDLIQETFAACVRGRDRLRSDTRFRSYLFSTAYNVLKSYFTRNSGPRKAEALESYAVNDLAPGASTLMRTHEQDRLLLDALRRIPLEFQVVLEMQYWENMSSTEIGEVLGLPAATVRTRTFRGREKLVGILSKSSDHRSDTGPSVPDLDTWAMRIREMMGRQGA